MKIRPFDFSDADYQAYVEVFNTAHAEAARSVRDMQHRDQSRTKDDVLGRFVAEVGGKVVGLVEYETSFDDPKPGVLEVHYRICPEFGGLAPALWDYLMGEIDRVKPHELKARVREDWDEYRFYLNQGFEEEDRSWVSTLDVFSFDPAPLQRPLAEGVRIQALSELPYHKAELQHQLYNLEEALIADVPTLEPMAPWPFEVWHERVLQDPNLLPEGCFVALDGTQPVGLSQLKKSNRPQTLQTGLTGVLSNYRRRGIASALKLRAAEFARQYGARYIRTGNHQRNRPMLTINEAMGFEKEPAMVLLRKLG